MNLEEASVEVLHLLKNDDVTACSKCIAKKINKPADDVQSILDTLVGLERAERIGRKTGDTVVGLGCWDCGENEVTYRYALRFRDLFNPKHWR